MMYSDYENVEILIKAEVCEEKDQEAIEQENIVFVKAKIITNPLV